MSFIGALLARWGLQALVPYLLPGFIGLLVSSGIGTVWWLGYTDFPSIILASGILILTATIFAFQSRAVQLIALVGLIIGCYLFGRHQESVDVEARISAAVTEAVNGVHSEYAKISEQEKRRQAEEAEMARKRAELERKSWEETFATLNRQLEELYEAAARDQNANRPAFGLEAIDRLNKMRGNELLKE